MTKISLTQFVADKLQKTDQGSLDMIKSFIDRRYEMIWDSALWRTSLGTTSYTVEVDTQVVTLLTTVDFPVAAAWDDKEITPVDYSSVFQVDPTLFNDSGEVVNFIVIDSGDGVKIKLLRKPKEEKTLLVLGKLKMVALTLDTHSPVINGIDNSLLAFVEGDMLEHLRQYGKAQVKYQEAASQLQIAKDMETHQSASSTRIIPEVKNDWNSDDFI